AVLLSTLDAAAQERVAVPQYEYSHLMVMTGESLTFAVWHDAERHENARSLYDLFTMLGGEADERRFSIVELLNLVGSRGWRMVATEKEDRSSTYCFIREVRTG